MQHIAHMDHMIEETSRLVQMLPKHKDMGMEEAAKQRFAAAANQAHNFSIPQLQTLTEKSENIIQCKLAARRKEDSTHITDRIEEILDPEQATSELIRGLAALAKPRHLPLICGGEASIIVIHMI